MELGRWKQIEEIFHKVADAPVEDRARLLAEACGDDADLRSEVEALLRSPSGTLFGDLALNRVAREMAQDDKPFGEGQRLGSYTVVSLLGKGGMGEVYRARDSRLGRDVALKVLPASFALDPDHVARFDREARLLAGLNHPNIATIHGLEEHSGRKLLVLELIEGEALADRIRRGPIPVEEARKLALQIAEALEAAHEKGVVHRDLKPENIQITAEGRVKVLDFGLARAFTETQPDMSGARTMAPTVTRAGVVLGTPAYMSPEQASGEEVDRRTDVWAYGCICYEMLTGRRPFSGEGAREVIGSILKTDPDWSLLPRDVPARIRLMLERCLEKSRKDRYQGIADARVDIERAQSSEDTVAPASASRPGRSWAVAVAVAAIAIAVAALLAFDQLPPEPTRYLSVEVDGDVNRGSQIAISPDGGRLVYASGEQLWLRSLDEAGPATPLPGTETAYNPFFSPDGAAFGFFSVSGGLRRLDLENSESRPVALLAEGRAGTTGAWEGDYIYYGAQLRGNPASDGLFRALASGSSDADPLIDAAGVADMDFPEVLPGGEWILYTELEEPGDWNNGRIVAESLETRDRKILVERGYNARYLATGDPGHLVFARNGRLFAVVFDPERVETYGTEVQLSEEVLVDAETGFVSYSVSDDGTLAYLPGGVPPEANRVLAWASLDGEITRMPRLEPMAYRSPRVSPDGRRIAFAAPVEGRMQIWIYDIDGDTRPQVVTREGNNDRPVWTPDSLGITFMSDRGGTNSIWSMTLADSQAVRITPTEVGVQHWPDAWSPDGTTLAFTRLEGSLLTTIRAQDLWTVTPSAGTLPSEFARSAGGAAFSPDGNYIAYRNNDLEQGSDNQLNVRPFPGSGPTRTVTEGTGTYPVWVDDRLFFRRTIGAPVGGPAFRSLAMVDFASDGTLRVREEKDLPIGFDTEFGVRNFDVDGERILLIVPAADQNRDGSTIRVVVNWFTELKDRVPPPPPWWKFW